MIRVDIMDKNVDKNNTKEVITVEDIDRQKRKPNEWAKIYNIKLIECDDYNALQNEYEWAWEMMHSYKYLPLPDKTGDYELSSEKELRAEMLVMDIYINALPKEKYIFNTHKKYIDTDFIRRRLNLI